MKKQFVTLAFIALAALAFTSCKPKQNADGKLSTDLVTNPASANGDDDQEYVPVMVFEKDVHEFGKIVEGEKVSYSFKFKNTGKVDLIISDAKGSCGCTVPQWPKNPVAPGADGVIDVTFDSSGKSGMQNKTVTLITNAIPNTKVLTIMGEVSPRN